MNNIYIHSIFLVILTHFSSFAQKESKFYGSLDFKLPTSVTNTSFKGIMGGIADVNGNVTYRVSNRFEAGLGLKYGYFEVNSKAFQTNVTGRIEFLGINGSFLFTTELNENWFFEALFSGGPQKALTTTNLATSKYIQNSFYAQPGIGIYIKSSENLSFGLTSSYTFTTNPFTPKNLNLENFPSLSPETSNGTIGFFSIGFGFKARITKGDG